MLFLQIIAGLNLTLILFSIISLIAMKPFVIRERLLNPVIHTYDTSQSVTIKAMTYNILNSFTDSDEKCKKNDSRAQKIASYLTENNFDIIFLQEAGCNEILQQEWAQQSGKVIDSVEIGYINKKMGILSRLTMEKDAAGNIISNVSEMYAGDRKTLTLKINTSLGQIRLFNIHPHNFCTEQNYIWTFIDQFKNENIPYMIGGDYNSKSLQNCVTDIDHNYVRSCATDKSCYNSSGKNSSTKPGNPIDHILVSKQTGLYTSVISSSVSLNGNELFGGISDHWPVTADILVTKIDPTPIPTPTIEPSVSPSSIPIISPTISDPGKTVDLNDDGIVNVSDFISFIDLYEVADCTIDYNNNNICREITDFKLFSEQYSYFYI